MVLGRTAIVNAGREPFVGAKCKIMLMESRDGVGNEADLQNDANWVAWRRTVDSLAGQIFNP
jgi:hypothetical protein